MSCEAHNYFDGDQWLSAYISCMSKMGKVTLGNACVPNIKDKFEYFLSCVRYKLCRLEYS